jgi:hypothetical protein
MGCAGHDLKIIICTFQMYHGINLSQKLVVSALVFFIIVFLRFNHVFVIILRFSLNVLREYRWYLVLVATGSVRVIARPRAD